MGNVYLVQSGDPAGLVSFIVMITEDQALLTQTYSDQLPLSCPPISRVPSSVNGSINSQSKLLNLTGFFSRVWGFEPVIAAADMPYYFCDRRGLTKALGRFVAGSLVGDGVEQVSLNVF